nr:GNAT family N-acetyltransferase [Actinopolymorpha rutila]
MQVTLVEVPEDAKPVLRRLLEFNAYEFSVLDGRDLGPHGEYGYRYLDHYWDERERRVPLFFEVKGHVAGFTLLRMGPPHAVAEFLVLPKYRRHGVGQAAARQVFTRWPGDWTTHQVAGNDRAVAFWRSAIPVLFEESADSSGTSQRFRT